MRRALKLAALAAASCASAQAIGDGEAAANSVARKALSRAEVRTIVSQVRTIKALNGNLAGSAQSVAGNVFAITTAQRSLAADGLASRVVNGSLEVSLPGDVLFDFDKSTIRASAVATLEKVRNAAEATGDRPVTVAGHTDAVGVAAHNQLLSEARARVVADWLAQAGVRRSRLTSHGFGATRPVAPNKSITGSDDPAGRQRNRRVTITL